MLMLFGAFRGDTNLLLLVLHSGTAIKVPCTHGRKGKGLLVFIKPNTFHCINLSKSGRLFFFFLLSF